MPRAAKAKSPASKDSTATIGFEAKLLAARPGFDKQQLGELIDVIATIKVIAAREAEKTHRSLPSSRRKRGFLYGLTFDRAENCNLAA